MDISCIDFPKGRDVPDSVPGFSSGTKNSVPEDHNVVSPFTSGKLSKELEGTWEGTHEAGGKVRRVGSKLLPATDGTATATLIAVEQGNLGIPVTTVTIKDKELRLAARAVSGTYRGTLGRSDEIAGEWSEGPNHFPLAFKRVSSESKEP